MARNNRLRGNDYRSASWAKCGQPDESSGRVDDGTTSIARLFSAANGALRRNPSLFVENAGDMGLRPKESEAIRLLPSRLADIYLTDWNQDVWTAIDRQIEVAVKVGLLDGVPSRRLYDGLALGAA